MWWLLLLAWQGAAWREVAADAVDGEVLTAVRATMAQQQQREPTPSMAAVARCLSEDQAIQCLERRANRYREALVSEQQVFESRALHPPETQAAMKEAQDLFISLLPNGPEDKEQGGEDSILNLNGRGHKLKKKIQKIIKIIKIIIFIVVVKLKMVFLMLMMQTLFQFKLVAITFMILLIKKYYLWVEWKHKKEEKKAVVYYEHAQHQHHYDESDHFHDGLGGLLGHGAGHEYHKGVEPTAGAEAGGGWGGWWGKRSAEYPTPIVPSGGVPAPGGVPNAAHHLAYSAHVQQPLVG